MSTQETPRNYGKPPYWSQAKWEAWKQQLATHFSPHIGYTVIKPACEVQHVERLRAFEEYGPLLTVVEYEGKRYKGILFEMEGEG